MSAAATVKVLPSADHRAAATESERLGNRVATLAVQLPGVYGNPAGEPAVNGRPALSNGLAGWKE